MTMIGPQGSAETPVAAAETVEKSKLYSSCKAEKNNSIYKKK